MCALHDKHIVHRDLKPANIFVDDERASESDAFVQTTDDAIKVAVVAKIGDLGVSRFLQFGKSQPLTGELGTRPFWAPEMHVSSQWLPASDVHAFGTLMYTTMFGISQEAWGKWFREKVQERMQEACALPLSVSLTPRSHLSLSS